MSRDDDAIFDQFFEYVRESYSKKIESIHGLLASQTPIRSFPELDERFIPPMLKALEAIYSDQIILTTAYQQIRALDIDSIKKLNERVNRGEMIDNWWDRTFRTESEIANAESNG